MTRRGPQGQPLLVLDPNQTHSDLKLSSLRFSLLSVANFLIIPLFTTALTCPRLRSLNTLYPQIMLMGIGVIFFPV